MPANTTSGVKTTDGDPMLMKTVGEGETATQVKGPKAASGRKNVRVEYYVPLPYANEEGSDDATRLQRAIDAYPEGVDVAYEDTTIAPDPDADEAMPTVSRRVLGAWFAEDQDTKALTTFMAGRTHMVLGTANKFSGLAQATPWSRTVACTTSTCSARPRPCAGPTSTCRHRQWAFRLPSGRRGARWRRALHRHPHHGRGLQGHRQLLRRHLLGGRGLQPLPQRVHDAGLQRPAL